MRLIDADLLKETFDLYTDRKGYLKADPIDLIDNAPNVEGEILTEEAYSDLCLRASKERPQGEWIHNETSKYSSLFCSNPGRHCSICGRVVEFSENYCPKCGAQMKI